MTESEALRDKLGKFQQEIAEAQIEIDAMLYYRHERDVIHSSMDAAGVPLTVDVGNEPCEMLIARFHWLIQDYNRLKSL